MNSYSVTGGKRRRRKTSSSSRAQACPDDKGDNDPTT